MGEHRMQKLQQKCSDSCQYRHYYQQIEKYCAPASVFRSFQPTSTENVMYEVQRMQLHTFHTYRS